MNASQRALQQIKATKEGKVQRLELFSDVPSSLLNALTSKDQNERITGQQLIESNLDRAQSLIERIKEKRTNMNRNVMDELRNEEIDAAQGVLRNPQEVTEDRNISGRVAGELFYPDVQMGRPGKTTLLHEMVSLGLLEEVRKILAVTAEKNPRDVSGSTPAHIAAQEGHEAILVELIGGGASIAARDLQGKSPLHRAVEFGRSFLIDLFVRLGADLNERDARGRASLHMACEQSSSHQLEALLTAGEGIINLEAADCRGFTPLHVAAERGNETAVRILIARGADPNAKGPTGMTPLMLATHSERLACLRVLVHHPDCDLYATDALGRTALTHAVMRRCAEAVGVLVVETGPDRGRALMALPSELGTGRCAIHTASLLGDDAVVLALLGGGCEVNVRDKGGVTPLHLAASGGHTTVIARLIRGGAAKEARTDGGEETAMHFAVRHDHGDAIALLASLGCDCNSVSQGGRTPLMHAVLVHASKLAPTSSTLLAPGPSSPLKRSGLLNRSEVPPSPGSGSPTSRSARENSPSTPKAFIPPSEGDYHHSKTALEALLDLVPRQQSGQEAPQQSLGGARTVRIDQQDRRGDTALHLAAAKGDGGAVRALVQAGASLRLVNDAGDTALSIAVDKGDTRLVRMLVITSSQGVTSTPLDLIRDGKGFTPLQRAVTRGDVSMVSTLVQLGSKNEHGHPSLGAWALAKQMGHQSLERALFKKPPASNLTVTRVDLERAVAPDGSRALTGTLHVELSRLVAAVSPVVTTLRLVIVPVWTLQEVMTRLYPRDPTHYLYDEDVYNTNPTKAAPIKRLSAKDEKYVTDLVVGRWSTLVGQHACNTRYPLMLDHHIVKPRLHRPVDDDAPPVRIAHTLIEHYPRLDRAQGFGGPTFIDGVDDSSSLSPGASQPPKTSLEAAVSKWQVNEEALSLAFPSSILPSTVTLQTDFTEEHVDLSAGNYLPLASAPVENSSRNFDEVPIGPLAEGIPYAVRLQAGNAAGLTWGPVSLFIVYPDECPASDEVDL